MKHSASLAAALLSLTPVTFAAISLSISKDPPTLNPKFRARDTIDESLINQVSKYKTSITLGTPPQEIRVQLDTGSSDLWVFENTAPVCATDCPDGSFNPTTSSTFQEVVPDGFFISYVDNSAAEGDYVADSFSFGEGSGTVTGLQFGLVQNANGTIVNSEGGAHGIMGIGYDTLEATTDIYPNIPDQLVAQGLIDAKAYSLHLDDVLSDTGSILFGGIDADKFVGTLSALPVQQEDGKFSRLNVLLSSLSLTSGGESTSLLTTPVPAALDSGASFSVLDDDLVKEIFTALGAVDDTAGSSGVGWVDCNIRCTMYDDTFTFGFGTEGGPVIKVPVAESIIGPFAPPDGLELPFGSACIAAFLPLGSITLPIYILGDSFLRSAYAVFDLQNNEIALAQSNLGATAENIQDIPAGATGIPLLSGVEAGVTKLPLHSTCPPTTSTTPPTSTKTSTEEPSTTAPTTTGGEGPTTTPTHSPTSWSNSTITSSRSTITSTKTTTTVYTITSCPPIVTSCPYGQVTTETLTYTTTFCPGETPIPTYIPHKPYGSITSTITKTTIYTVTSCPPTVTSCPIGKETTEIITTTTVCPVTESELPTLVPTTTLVPPTYPGGGAATSTGGGVSPPEFTGGVDRVTVGGLSVVVAMLFGLIAM